jgi:hypothetical protein
MVLTCDNEYVLTVNGSRIGADRDWETVEVFDLSRVLKEGKNVVRVEGVNAGQGPNAAAFFGWIEFTAGDETGRLTTDDRWLANGQPAVIIRNGPWGARLQGTLGAYWSGEPGETPGMSRKVRASLVNSTLLMRALGRPNREQVVTSRPDGLTTLQALELNNGEEFVDYLKEGATRLSSLEGDLVDRLYRAALGRPPSDLEAQVAGEILQEAPSQENLADLLWSILMLPEFQLIN